MKKTLLGLLLTGFTILLVSPLSAQKRHTEVYVDQEKLSEFITEQRQAFESRRQLTLKRAEAWNYPLLLPNDGGNGDLYLEYVDEAGRPWYRGLRNRESAVTIGVDQLYNTGNLGLDLSGEGMTIGIWDGGRVRETHVEFGERVTNNTGRDLSSHATHVTGTSIAAGINASAKGMAYKANAIAYDFFGNDIGQMATEAARGLLVSNHSYGLVVGWRFDDGAWQWNGGDGDEDDRFGRYTAGHSKAIDDITNAAPYYTIVWAAGNDRNDVGDGTRQPDGPYDCLGPESVAKNNMVIGAVEGVPDYTGPNSVPMANFSSWGPTDDGRIKPDLVAKGVAVFSTGIDDDSHYFNNQGTSMAAPAAAGAFLLLQEHYHDVNDTYMRSSTLRALTIHTAKETGTGEGPDYQYGWGLLDAAAASQVISHANSRDTLILEETLAQGETFEYQVFAEGNAPLRATIAWIDPSGTPPAQSIDPTDLMLVNDLDLRIFDDAGNEYEPYILDPANPNRTARKGDNFRDNVEMVLLNDPEPRNYTIRVSHKGELRDGAQPFSLILTGKTSFSDIPSLYWVGEQGDWHNGDNWSLSSGGPAAGVVPDSTYRVVFDENSFVAGGGDTVSIGQDAVCHSLNWIAKEPNALFFTGAELNIWGVVSISSNRMNCNAATWRLKNAQPTFSSLFFNNARGLEQVRLVLDQPGNTWLLESPTNLKGIHLVEGTLLADNQSFKLGELSSTSGLLLLENMEISGLDSLRIQDPISFNFEGNTLVFDGDAPQKYLQASGIDWANNLLQVGSGNLQVMGEDLNLPRVSVGMGAGLYLDGSHTVQDLALDKNSTLTLKAGVPHYFGESFNVISNADSMVNIQSDVPGTTANLDIEAFVKLCLDYLNVSDIEVTGNVAFGAGVNSNVSDNSVGVINFACEDVIFSNFDVDYPCAGGITAFTDSSDGQVASWEWDFGDPSNPSASSMSQNAAYIYNEPGTYMVSLTIGDGENTHTQFRELDIIENTLQKATIVESGTERLASVTSGDSYQWFADGDSIPGATERVLELGNNFGNIQVLVVRDNCTSLSDPFVVTSLEEELAELIELYPNPSERLLNIALPPAINQYQLSIIDMLGKEMSTRVVSATGQSAKVDISNLPPASYVLLVTDDKNNTYRKLFVKF